MKRFPDGSSPRLFDPIPLRGVTAKTGSWSRRWTVLRAQEDVVRNGQADIVALAREFIYKPNWPQPLRGHTS